MAAKAKERRALGQGLGDDTSGANALASPSPAGALGQGLPPLDMDVTVLAFAQWVSEMKTRQTNSQHQMTAEMSIIRNAITTNNTDLADFKRHSAAVQQQMQREISEIRESLSNVFQEITAAVRNNSAADQDIKLKIQSLNEQFVRNETAFAQLADAADQSQSKLRAAVQEMQSSSERMRDELVTVNRYTEHMENMLNEKFERSGNQIETLAQDEQTQLEQRKEHIRKMSQDVLSIGESLQSLLTDFGEQKRQTGQIQSKVQSSLYALDQTGRRYGAPSLLREGGGTTAAAGSSTAGGQTDLRRELGRISEGLTATTQSLQQAVPYATTVAAGAPAYTMPTTTVTRTAQGGIIPGAMPGVVYASQAR